MISAEEAAGRLAEAEAAGRLSGAAAANIRRWLTEAPFARYRARLAGGHRAGIDGPSSTTPSSRVLEFGTGGRRGKMYPVGTNVLNERTMAESARGLADYVTAKKGPQAPRSCAIARDTRHHSAEFAELCARRDGGGRVPRRTCSATTARPPCSPSPCGTCAATPAS